MTAETNTWIVTEIHRIQKIASELPMPHDQCGGPWGSDITAALEALALKVEVERDYLRLAADAVRFWRECRARISAPEFTGNAVDVMREAEARLLAVSDQ